MRKRVVVTGMGVVCSLGDSLDGFWRALLAGADGIGPITVADVSDFTHQQGGEVIDIPTIDDVDELASDDRAAALALSAVDQAWRQAGWASGAGSGVALGTNFGSIATTAADLGTDHPVIHGDLGFQAAVDGVASHWACDRSCVSLSLSCSSGTAAIGHGANLIRNGRAERVVAGGYDAISRFSWAGLSVLRTMTTERIRPFDLNRSGTLFAEGAAVLCLEERDVALARKAPVFAEVAGFGFNNNAFHVTAPPKDGEGLAAAMRMALADADLAPAAVDHVNAHGTGTKANDVTETRAIKTVLGERAKDVPVTSVKSMTGHLMGAAGAAEAIAAIMSLRGDVVPPTINLNEPDPECDLRVPVNSPLELPLKTVISNSSGIGGNNACLVFTSSAERRD